MEEILRVSLLLFRIEHFIRNYNPPFNLVLYNVPTGHTTFLRLWINVIDVDSTSQQRGVTSR